jgi:23S rRNA C2498 (ribose-2'-O)-methylase RlmM
MALLKAVAGGLVSLLFAWIVIVSADLWKAKIIAAKHGATGLGAVSGGWTLLMRSPVIVLVLSAAFGLGFFFIARLAGRH